MSHTNESCYHLIFDASPLPAWISDATSGRILLVNDAALHLYGYSREEFLALSVDALRPADPRMRRAPRPPHHAPPTCALDTDREHRQKNGALFTVRLQVVAFDIDGVPAHLTISLDAAPRDAALAQRELRLVEAQQLAHIGSWESNAVTGETSWSRELYLLYGAASDVTPGFGEFLSRVHEEDRARVSKTLADATVERKVRYDLECRVVLPDGSVRWLGNRHVATYDATGRLLQIRGTVQDITPQRVAEQALTESEQRHHLLTDDGGDIGAELNPAAEPRGRNPSDERVPGHAPIPLRILLVEDNLADQKIASTVLLRRGHHVTIVNDGKAAVAAVTAGSFDLVMMDVHLPVMNGVAATRAIRALPGVTALPIVAVTADASPSERERCLAAGLDDHLTKPFTARALSDFIESAAARRRAPASSARISSPLPFASEHASAARTAEVAAFRSTMREADAGDAADAILDTFLADAARRKASVLAALESGDGADAVVTHLHTLRPPADDR